MKLVWNKQELPNKGWWKLTRKYVVSKFRKQTYGVIDSSELEDLLNSEKQLTIVDCRLEDTYCKFGHIPGAVSYPITLFENDCPEIERDRQLVVVCYFGFVCQLAARKLGAQGHKDVLILKGGMDAWNIKNRPLELL
ncbi:rhodanese-like domain-containing protein [Maridesulfovibrio salexigens]|uniref:Rhodanese domain protein n=1 Tax=Maridesulfovibrio salexigens (strain ATCC 14822 / DSM 2638 / NCIMB 8403 / VKM B-1763) TaxID=526222 RepID=C6BZG7_MARSD|nr:rhodanese-like domain-containing protein [Maridesulfovibrio salexigens]ACS80804.1 Rhodanese domain protein [Maridesulfovibrio salexigens DSM 2638]